MITGDIISESEDDQVVYDDVYDDDDLSTMSGWNSSVTSSLTTSLTDSYATAAGVSTRSVGSVLTTSNTGSLVWNNTITSTGTPGWISAGVGLNDLTAAKATARTLQISGSAIFEEDITVKGVKLSERLDAIEERLGILRPNNDLENKWEKLKALGEEYRNLEKEILDGESVWDILKK